MTTTTTFHYTYQQNPVRIPTLPLPACDNAGHADHWAIVGANDSRTLHQHLRQSIEVATIPVGLFEATTRDDLLLLGADSVCHIKQILKMHDNKPQSLMNAFPAVHSPYSLPCVIEEQIVCSETQDAILRLKSGNTTIYAFDTLYAINKNHYKPNQSYTVNFGAWAYDLQKSDQSETIHIEDPEAIRYHRAFNDIVAQNNGKVPDDIQQQIQNWQAPSDEPLAPVQINVGHSCIYLFGEVFGQQDEAWCQGQVLGKTTVDFLGQSVDVFDVAILQEDNRPFVVKIAAPQTPSTQSIAVLDYIQSNIWLQASIYALAEA